MTVWAYLRVSSEVQDEQNQRLGVDLKAKELGINIDKYVVDKVSGAKDPRERSLGKLLRHIKKGDTLIVSEISRLGRRLFMIMQIISIILNKQCSLYSVKENFSVGDNIQSKVLIFAFGLAAEIERNLISQRTKEALQRRKQMGKHLGRPFGFKVKNHKLDAHRTRIQHDLAKGISKSRLARRYKVCLKTMRKYIDMHNLSP